jgi:transcriptional regulator with XRE-family HTH domain
MAGRGATDIDELIGLNIKARRTQLKIKAVAIAEHLGITAARYGMYERGQNRIAASFLVEIAKFLDDTPISTFYAGINVHGPNPAAPPPEPWETRILAASPHGRKLLIALKAMREPELITLTRFLEAMSEPHREYKRTKKAPLPVAAE